LRQLKKLDRSFSTYGSQFGIKQCCLIWFYCVWSTLRADKDINQDYRIKSFDEQGIILCPECLVNQMENT
jgi:hypothetical protein